MKGTERDRTDNCLLEDRQHLERLWSAQDDASGLVAADRHELLADLAAGHWRVDGPARENGILDLDRIADLELPGIGDAQARVLVQQ